VNLKYGGLHAVSYRGSLAFSSSIHKSFSLNNFSSWINWPKLTCILLEIFEKEVFLGLICSNVAFLVSVQHYNNIITIVHYTILSYEHPTAARRRSRADDICNSISEFQSIKMLRATSFDYVVFGVFCFFFSRFNTPDYDKFIGKSKCAFNFWFW